MPSWNCCSIVSEMMNVASEMNRPRVLIVFAAERGKNASTNAAAIGSQMMVLSTWVMPSTAASLLGASLAPRSGERVAEVRVRGSCEDPYENDHSQEEHQRVVAHVARLYEAQQIADRSDDVAAQRQDPVNECVDTLPEES